MEKLNVQGQCQTVNSDSPTIEIPLPQLPFYGAWSVNGTILALNTDALSPPQNDDSVALLLFISGNSVGGTALRNDGGTTPYTTYPPTGGLDVSVSVGLGTLGLTQSLYLTLNNAVEGATVAWGWDLDIHFLTPT